MIFNMFYSLDFITIFSEAILYSKVSYNLFGIQLNYLELSSFFLICAACVKSAQLGAHV
jgi:hypothetical protein